MSVSLDNAFNTKISHDNGASSAQAKADFSAEIKGAKGYGFKFGVNAEATTQTNLSTKDGTTSFTVTTDVSVTADASVSAPAGGGGYSATAGTKATYDVSMPEEVATPEAINNVNPYDPESMPTGTVITMDDVDYQGSAFEASFKAASVSIGREETQGTSYVVEKTGEDTVRVTIGPTGSVSESLGLGMDIGAASVSFGLDKSMDDARLKTAEFDLSTPEGKAAYQDFLVNGTMPEENGPGVNNVHDIAKYTATVDSKIEWSVGSFSGTVDVSEGADSMSVVATTNPDDGTVSVVSSFRYDEDVALSYTQKYDAAGNEIVSEREYTYTITANEYTDGLINAFASGNSSQESKQNGEVKPGDTVTITLTEDEMADLQAAGKSIAEKDPSMAYLGGWGDDSVTAFGFATDIIRQKPGSEAVVEALYYLADENDGSSGDGNTKLPGDVQVS